MTYGQPRPLIFRLAHRVRLSRPHHRADRLLLHVAAGASRRKQIPLLRCLHTALYDRQRSANKWNTQISWTITPSVLGFRRETVDEAIDAARAAQLDGGKGEGK